MKKIILCSVIFSSLLVGFSSLINNDQVAKAEESNAPAENLTLRIYNWEDYINTDDEGHRVMVDEFINDYASRHGGVKPIVKYSTFDTNETMYNNVFTDLNEQYDLICPSDYIIEKLMREDKLEKIDQSKIPNYYDNVSPYLKKKFDEFGFTDYAVGYMWGTVGLTFNADMSETIMEDIKSWDVLWDKQYKYKISVKDSMRDTYIIGVMKVYKEMLDQARNNPEEFYKLHEEFKTYNEVVQHYFDKHDPETLEKVEKVLKELKKNIYGFEVDSGKYDVVTGKVDINLAWSGDAVESIDTAADEDKGRNLKFYVPQEGSNVWFDGWVMPKGANTELAYEFLNFISRPDKAVENMDYIGYTSFIGGDDVIDYVKETYAADEGETISKDLTFYFEENPEMIADEDRIIINYPKEEEFGRFDTQFPSEDVLSRCAVMHDFGDGNDNVVKMWTKVRSSELTIASYIFLSLVVLACISYCAYIIVKKQRIKKRRAKRLAQKSV